MTSGTERKAPASPRGLHLQNRLTAVRVEKAPDVPPSKGSDLPNPKPHMTDQEEMGSHQNG